MPDYFRGPHNSQPSQSIYVVATTREGALYRAWMDTEGNIASDNGAFIAYSATDLAAKVDFKHLRDQEQVFRVAVEQDWGATTRIKEAIDDHWINEEKVQARRNAEIAEKRAEEERRREKKAADRAALGTNPTTSLHRLLSGEKTTVEVAKTEPSLPENIRSGNFNLAVEGIVNNPDGSITVTGKIDAKQLANIRR